MNTKITSVTLHDSPSGSAISIGGTSNWINHLVVSVRIQYRKSGIDRMTFSIPSASTAGRSALAKTAFTRFQNIKITHASGTTTWWSIESPVLSSASSTVDITCLSYLSVLDRRIARIRREPSGFMDVSMSLIEVTAEEAITAVLNANASSVFEVGTVHSSLSAYRFNFEINGQNHLDALHLIRKALSPANGGIPAEISVRWVGAVCYLDVVPFVGASASEISASYTPDPSSRLILDPTGGAGTANRLKLISNTGGRDFFNRIIPLAGEADEQVTIAGAEWLIASAVYSGITYLTTITLERDALASPFSANSTLWFGSESTQYEIESILSGNSFSVSGDVSGDVSALSSGIFFSTATGGDLVQLEDSTATADAISEMRVQFPVSPYANLLKNITGISEDLSSWTLGLPDGVDVTGLTVTEYDSVTYPAYVKIGTKAVHCSGDKDAEMRVGEGLLSLDPTAQKKWFSVSLHASVLSGRIRVELVDSEGIRHPQGSDHAESNSKALIALQLGGIEPSSGSAYISITALEDGTEFVVDALVLTRSTTPWQFSPDMGPSDLWMLGLEYLRINGGDQERFETDFIDSTLWDVGAEPVESGSWVRIKTAWNGTTYNRIVDARVQELRVEYSSTGQPLTKSAKVSNDVPDIVGRLLTGVGQAQIITAPTSNRLGDYFESTYSAIASGDIMAVLAIAHSAGSYNSLTLTANVDIEYGTMLEIRDVASGADAIPFYLTRSIESGTTGIVTVSAVEPVYTVGLEGQSIGVTNQASVTLPVEYDSGKKIYQPLQWFQNTVRQLANEFSVVQLSQQLSSILERVAVIGETVSGAVTTISNLKVPLRMTMRTGWTVKFVTARGVQSATLSADAFAGATTFDILSESLDLREDDIVRLDPIQQASFLRIEPEEVQLGVETRSEALSLSKVITPLPANTYGPSNAIPLDTTLGIGLDNGDLVSLIDRNGRKTALTVYGAHSSVDTSLFTSTVVIPSEIIGGILQLGDVVLSSKITINTDNINLRVQKNDVINQINISTEGILIEADNIEINGNVTFSAGYDPTTKAETYVSATQPVGAPSGSLWKDTSTTPYSIYRFDGATWEIYGTEDADWRSVSNQTYIDGGKIYTNSVTTNEVNFTVVDTANIIGTINASTEGLDIQFNKVKISGKLDAGDSLTSDGFVDGASGWSTGGSDDIQLWIGNDLVISDTYGIRFGGTQPIEWRNSLPSGTVEAKIWSPNTQGAVALFGDDGGLDHAELVVWGILRQTLMQAGGNHCFAASSTVATSYLHHRFEGDIHHVGTGVGLYSTTPRPQGAVVGKLTSGIGTISSTLTAVSGSGADATINNNFESIDAKLDLIIDRIGSTAGIGITAD